MRSLFRRILRRLGGIGAYPGESPDQAGRRRIFIGITVVATLLSTPFIFDSLDRGHDLVAVSLVVLVVAGPFELLALHLRPSWFRGIVHVVFLMVTVQQLYVTWLFGGLIESGLAAIFGLVVAVAARIILGQRAALFWFVAYLVQIAYGMTISGEVEPAYVFDDPTTDSGLNLISLGILTMGAVIYFASQRDRFQKESDDLLHSILPDEIALRLKADTSMIADAFPESTVLFADVVGFTPMSADMAPEELVGLLNTLFSEFDEIVEDLGLEKIKTVGDEYMVAGGVPVPREDHAEAIAVLALRILDHMSVTEFLGAHLQMRIGINSGPVVAGIIGTHKFSYDLWGDTVNTASRMESEGVPGRIQVTAATRQLLADKGFSFEPRGSIAVKGKGEMETWLLTGRA